VILSVTKLKPNGTLIQKPEVVDHSYTLAVEEMKISSIVRYLMRPILRMGDITDNK